MRNVAIAMALAALLPFVVLSYDIFPGEKQGETVGEYGTVKEVSSCRRVHKQDYECRVSTSLATYPSMEVTRFPGSRLQVGDRIFILHRLYERKRETLLCKNNTCTPSSFCLRWMPCFEDLK